VSDDDTDLIGALHRRVAELEAALDAEQRQSSFWFAAWRDLKLAVSPMSNVAAQGKPRRDG